MRSNAGKWNSDSKL